MRVERAWPRVGYPCMNLLLGMGTNRTLRLASLGDAKKVRGVVGANLDALEAILAWNAAHGVRLFRVGSQVVPFASHEGFPYHWQAEHGKRMQELGAVARASGQRLSIHPGQYVCPGSPDAGVVGRSVAELRYAADVVELLDPSGGVVVVHAGGAYGDKPAAAERFVDALRGEAGVLRHLALENDERIWTAGEVIGLASRLGVAAIVDTLHHRLNPGLHTVEAAVRAAAPTWTRGRRQKLHISSQDPAKVKGAHAYGITAEDWAELLGATRGLDVDVMVEAKGKEQALRMLGIGEIQPLPEGSVAAAGADD